MSSFREGRQKFYDSFLSVDLETLPLKSSSISLYDYLQIFDYPGRTKVSKTEALEICMSFKAAIQSGWVGDIMNIDGKIGHYWIPPGGSSEEAIPSKDVSDHFRKS